MDITKLDKMKVVDLRSELQARGLDTKGVKAILIERLKKYLENKCSEETVSTNAVNTVTTPTKRTRRTRSRTKSPSPVVMKQAEPTLEALPEENSSENNQDNQSVQETNEIVQPDDVLMTNPEEKQVEEETCEEQQQENVVYHQDENSEQSEMQTSEENSNEQPEYQEEASIQETPESENNEEPMVEEKVEEDEKLENEETQEDMQSAEEVMETEETQAQTSTAQDKVEEVKEEEEASADMETESPTKEKEERKSVAKRSRSRSRSRSADHTERSRSRQRSLSESGSGAEQAKDYTKDGFSAEDMKNVAEDEPLIEENQFGLSWFDSDLHLTIDPVTFNSAKQLSHDVFALVWSGARANFGVREGKVCFEVRLSEETGLSKTHKFRDEKNIRGFRLGFSLAKSTCLQLGESELSYAYCESGKKAVNKEFSDYGKPFGLDDVVACYLDLESSPSTIKYTLNGEDLGVAFEIDKEALGDEALFPHVLCKGYEFQVNFADNENLLVNAERQTRRRLKPKATKPCVEETSVKKDDETEQETKNDEQQADNENNQDEEDSTENKDIEEKKSEAEETTNGEKESAEVTSEEKVEEKAADEAEDGPSPNKRQKLEGEESQEEATENNTDINEKAKETAEKEAEDEYEDVEPVPREPMQLLEDYELIALIPEEKYVAGPQRPESRKDCEVIILIGLPGAGKTHWTLEHVQNKPEKRYDVIGADALIAKMTVDGEPRKTVHKGSWDTLYESCINSLSLLEEIAVKRRRNFILDQTNVYASVQRRKMKAFSNFKRTAVVCLPNEEELKRRIAEKQEKGSVYALREGTLANLQANFSLPSLEFAWFDDIIYTDLNGDEAKDEVKKINEKGKKSLDANRDKNRNRNRDYQKRDDRRRYDDRRRDYRSDHRSWNDRRAPYPNTGGPHNGSRWGPMGGGGNGMMGGYHRSGGGGGGSGSSAGWRDGDRGYGGSRGGHMRSYESNRQPQRYYGGQHNQNNWMHNRRYDDRFSRPSGGGGSTGSRYDSYGGGNSGGGRDYRDRERDRNGGGGGSGGGPRRDNYRNMGGNSGHQQRDFRLGHRDNRVEDSRGGYDRTTLPPTSNMSKHNDPAQPSGGNVGYDQYKNNGAHSKAGKWNSYNQYQNQAYQQQQAYYQQQNNNNWQQQVAEQNQYQQQQQQYWNYSMQGYGAEYQQQQQQEWMNWWQQQQATGGATSTTDATQYWQQYMYANQQPQPTSAVKSEGTTKKDIDINKDK